jgi:hypothetical protein
MEKTNKVEYYSSDKYETKEIQCIPYYDEQCISGGIIITIDDNMERLILETPEDSQEYEVDIKKMLTHFAPQGIVKDVVELHDMFSEGKE